MASADFHDRRFDEGTLTKLRIFELYTREWLPVFLANKTPLRSEIHVFDFFAGPGTDSEGTPGSPLRLLQQIRSMTHLPGWQVTKTVAHFFDEDAEKIAALRARIDERPTVPRLELDIKPYEFHEALTQSGKILQSPNAAKLLLIDQFGVDNVTPEVFKTLVDAPTCDFLFFLSSSTLHRFRDHPAIKQKIERPDDHYHVHRAALEYYRSLLKNPLEYYLAPFSIKKGANIYGLIFGSAHPLGMDKFLRVAWKQDAINGEADFDINRENFDPHQATLPLLELRPSKVTMFEAGLERRLRSGSIRNEVDVIRVCFEHGVTRQHAEPVLKRLKGLIDVKFRVPDVRRLSEPRTVRLKGRP